MALAVTATAPSTQGWTVTFTGVTSELTFEVEFNRSPDFASDESIIWPITTNPQNVSRQPAGTQFYMRGRSKTPSVGPWTPTVLVRTLDPTPAAAYTGFSIEPAILVVPEPIINLAATIQQAGYPASNLLNDDPTASWRQPSAGAPVLTFETSGTPIDTIALLGTLTAPGATWRIRGGATAAEAASESAPYDSGTVTFHTNSGLGGKRFYHGLHRLPAPVTHRFWNITLSVFNLMLAKHLVVGLARKSVNYSRGAGSAAADLGKMARTRFGTPDRTRGWRSRSVDFELSWLTEAEFETKWSDLWHRVGTTDPVLAVPNSKQNVYLNDRIAFGNISSMRSENVRSSRYIQSIEIASLY